MSATRVTGRPCKLWTGARSGPYGTRRYQGRVMKAHQAAYIEEYGPIPEGHEIHHTCETELCVEPTHLTALTPLEHKAAHGRASTKSQDPRPCSRCGREPRVRGQRWGRRCMNDAMRRHRAGT